MNITDNLRKLNTNKSSFPTIAQKLQRILTNKSFRYNKDKYLKKFVNLLSKKDKARLCTSKRTAIKNIAIILENPHSKYSKRKLELLGLSHINTDGVRSHLVTLAAMIAICNVESMRIATKKKGWLENVTFKYITKLTDCNEKTTRTHFRTFAKAALVSQEYKHFTIEGECYGQLASLKELSKKLFYILGVAKKQLNRDISYYKGTLEKPEPKTKPKQDTVDIPSKPDEPSNVSFVSSIHDLAKKLQNELGLTYLQASMKARQQLT